MNDRYPSRLLWSAFTVSCGLLLAGCLSSPRPAALRSSENAQIESRLAEIFDAAAKKDFARLDSYHLYTSAFTKFTSETPERMHAARAREGEHAGLSSISGLMMQPENLKIDLFNGSALATFILNYSFTVETNRFEKRTRSTILFVREAGEWKIVHEHLSSIPAAK
jgi:hypothetical protein